MYIDLSHYSFQRKSEKDLILKKKWDFGFDAIIWFIDHGYCIDIIKNPKAQYTHQDVLIILAWQYVLEVPCVIIDTTVYLITFYVSRSARRMYKDFILSHISWEN